MEVTFSGCTNYVRMPGSKQHGALDRRGLAGYLMGVVRTKFQWVLAPKRLTKRAVGLNECYLAVNSMAMMSLPQKACYHIHKSSCCVAA